MLVVEELVDIVVVKGKILGAGVEREREQASGFDDWHSFPLNNADLYDTLRAVLHPRLLRSGAYLESAIVDLQETTT